MVSYRTLLLIIAAVFSACAAWLLAHPAGTPMNISDTAPAAGVDAAKDISATSP